MENQEEAPKTQENRKIQLHLDGKDFEGFTFRLLEVAVPALALTWLTGWDGGLIFLIITIFWATFLVYKINQFKESAYQQIIQDLEHQNAQLEKTNKLLQNVVQDKLGMRISFEEKKANN